MKKKIRVGRSKLTGRVTISGAKNCALKILAASILTKNEIIIRNYPSRMLDVCVKARMLKQLGKSLCVEGDLLRIQAESGLNYELQWEQESVRTSLLLLGALLGRTGKGKVPLPGGCRIGERKYDLHISILEQLGARVWEERQYLCAESKRGLKGTELFLPLRSTGATEQAIIAGVLAAGNTRIWNPHVRPEVMDLIGFLNSMGAQIEVRGQESIKIRGVDSLSGTDYTIIPDNMEAMTYLIAACVTGGEIEIDKFPSETLEVPLIHLRESGAVIKISKSRVMVRPGECFPVEISTGPYPAINSDMQPLFAVYGICACGESRITDLRFPDRFGYAGELRKLGASCYQKGNMLIIDGGRPLKGRRVTALDLRCGAALLIAGLVAEDETVIENAQQIKRGYEDIIGKMRGLGANVSEPGE